MSALDDEWDETRAAALVGKIVLVGITYCDHHGNPLSDDQFFGEVASATQDGVLLSLRGKRAGTEWNMPPAIDQLQPAEPGTYRLKTADEEVVDPDFTVMWNINAAPPENVQ